VFSPLTIRSFSVRSTNVYEERSLGIYEDNASVDEENLSLSGNRMTVWGSYIALHARKQLAFGTISSHVRVSMELNIAD
jgi:hypothetical protein